jgi:O-antigen ligase
MDIQNGQQPSPWTVALKLLPLLGLLLPLLGYVVLPALGINGFTEAFGFKRILLLCGAAIGSVLYWHYLKLVLVRPQVLVAFILVAWPPVAFFNMGLLAAGINIHLRPLLILSIALPCLWLGIKYFRQLTQTIPWFKYYALFFGWLVLYFVFYNANAVDPRLSGGEEAMSEGSVSMVQLTAYFYCLLGIAITGITTLKTRNYKQLFDMLNQGLLWVSSIESLITIAGYPFGLFNLELDGFTRAIGIFTHPNPFSHHMGIIMIYLLGLFCYYQGTRQNRIPGWLIYSGITINFIAFLLGLSKTALGVFAVSSLIMLFMNLSVPAVRRSFIPIALGLLILVPVGLFAFSELSGHSFVSLLESRIDQTQSLDWRTMVWQDLLANITPLSIWFGHGFTSANDVVFHLTFNDAKNSNPLMMVHNAYIALLYDLGILGYLMFAAAVSMIINAFKGWTAALKPALRTEHSIIVGLVVYFLSVCAFDEMSYMFDAPMLFWTLATLLYCVNWREQRENRLEPVNLFPGRIFR